MNKIYKNVYTKFNSYLSQYKFLISKNNFYFSGISHLNICKDVTRNTEFIGAVATVELRPAQQLQLQQWNYELHISYSYNSGITTCTTATVTTLELRPAQQLELQQIYTTFLRLFKKFTSNGTRLVSYRICQIIIYKPK
jgi:hypothetical protein